MISLLIGRIVVVSMVMGMTCGVFFSVLMVLTWVVGLLLVMVVAELTRR